MWTGLQAGRGETQTLRGRPEFVSLSLALIVNTDQEAFDLLLVSFPGMRFHNCRLLRRLPDMSQCGVAPEPCELVSPQSRSLYVSAGFTRFPFTLPKLSISVADLLSWREVPPWGPLLPSFLLLSSRITGPSQLGV